MLTFRTTKEVATDLHSDETSLIEFSFTYNREKAGMYVKCDAYRVIGSDENETLELIPAGGSYRRLSQDELDALIGGAVAMTPADDNPLEYMDALVKNGIILVITTEGLWKGSLTVSDFA